METLAYWQQAQQNCLQLDQPLLSNCTMKNKNKHFVKILSLYSPEVLTSRVKSPDVSHYNSGRPIWVESELTFYLKEPF